MRVLLALSACALLAGCATNPDKIEPIHVSEFKYKEFTCQEMGKELKTLEDATIELYLRQKARYEGDTWRVTAAFATYGLSTLFFGVGDERTAYEYALLQGEMKALTTHIRTRECDIEIRPIDEVLKKADTSAHEATDG